MVRLDGGMGRSMAGRRRVLVRGAAVWCIASLAGACHALTGGSGPVEPLPEAPFSAVGSLEAGGRLYSAVLIGRQHVLTAAHVVAGAVPASVRFRSTGGGGFVGTGTAVHVHPAYTGNTTGNLPGDPSVHADLAIVRLDRPAPEGLPPARLFGGPLLGRTLTLVSHGGSTTLITSGDNRADVVFADALGRPATYLFDFDGPDLGSNRLGPAAPVNGSLGAQREATLVNGDSGSAAFVQIDGQWGLAGINTFEINFGAGPAERGAHGTGAGGVVLAGHKEWIRSVVTAPPPASAAPSPGSAQKKPSSRAAGTPAEPPRPPVP